MATCVDCVHMALCKEYHRMFWGSQSLVDSNIDDTEPENCRYFKDRSRFVDLPCNLGDVIFCTTMGKIYQGIVSRIELDDEGIAIITTEGYCFDSSICYHTQEEAEQALKECE